MKKMKKYYKNIKNENDLKKVQPSMCSYIDILYKGFLIPKNIF